MRRALAMTMGFGLVVACGSPEPPSIPPRLVVTVDVDGDPAGIAVRDGDALLGRTDEHGRLSVAGDTGRLYALRPECPHGRTPTTLSVRLDRPGETSRARLACRVARRVAIVAVGTSGFAELPVLVDGVAEAETDSAGGALIRVSREQGQTFEVTIDASGRPLEPARVTRAFRLDERDELFVLDAKFARKVRRRRSSPRPEPQREGPYELR